MNDEYMYEAFIEAEKAFKCGEVPVGAIIVKNGKILARAYNKKEKKCCSIYHAEILAIKKAANKLKNWRLDECEMYVTLDPCPMCASAIKQSRIKRVYSALSNKDNNNSILIRQIFDKDCVNMNVEFFSELSVEKSEMLLQKFFSERRKK